MKWRVLRAVVEIEVPSNSKLKAVDLRDAVRNTLLDHEVQFDRAIEGYGTQGYATGREIYTRFKVKKWVSK